MAAPDPDLKEYGFYDTMDEVLKLVIQHAGMARHATNKMELGVRLQMASRAMRCALEIYGDRFVNEKYVQCDSQHDQL